MNEPTLNLALPLSSVNAVLNALAQNGNAIQMTTQLIQQQAQQQLQPKPPTDGAANDSNVVPIGGPTAA